MQSVVPMPGVAGAGAGIVNVEKAIELAQSYGSAAAVPAANGGLTPSELLYSGTEPINWSSVNWNSVNWNSVNWNSVNWNSVNWNSVNWNSACEPGSICANEINDAPLGAPIILGDIDDFAEQEEAANPEQPNAPLGPIRSFLPSISN
jgi:hypothetical protein